MSNKEDDAIRAMQETVPHICTCCGQYLWALPEGHDLRKGEVLCHACGSDELMEERTR